MNLIDFISYPLAVIGLILLVARIAQSLVPQPPDPLREAVKDALARNKAYQQKEAEK